MLAYSYFFDKGDFASAGEALKEAAAIYNKSASNVRGEIFTSFVFGAAYIWRNAKSTRAWWTHMEAKKPVRVDVDYWLAASALHWIKGAILEARASLEKANTLASQLPKAGLTIFNVILGRYCAILSMTQEARM